MGGASERKTRPDECALAFALPRTCAEFASDLRCPPEAGHDLAAHMTERDPNRATKAEQYAADEYSVAERVIADVFRSVRAHRVTVIEVADLAAFAALFDNHTVVTLVSHWKSDVVHPDDVCDWVGLAAKVVSGADGILGWVADRLTAEASEILATAAIEPLGASQQATVALALTVALRSRRFAPPQGIDPDQGPAELNGYHNRIFFDEALTGVLRPGCRAEFRDGLYPVAAIAACVPESFSGTLDLTVCQSVFLAEGIKSELGRRGSIILANRDSTGLNLRLLLYKQVIAVIAKTPADYRNTVRAIRAAILFGSDKPMSNLKDVLEAAVSGEVMLGEDKQKTQLRQALDDVRTTNQKFFAILVGLLVVFFASSWVVVFLNRENPGVLSVVFGALGGTVFGSIWMMARMWRKKIAIEVVLATLDTLPRAERKVVMKTILDLL